LLSGTTATATELLAITKRDIQLVHFWQAKDAMMQVILL
jgi:hypothetical protein